MGATERYHVYVRFVTRGFNDKNLPYSLEPRAWHRTLVEHHHRTILIGDRPAIAFGYSEWPNSMNLLIDLHPLYLQEELRRLETTIYGAVDVQIFEPTAATPALIELIRKPYSAAA